LTLHVQKNVYGELLQSCSFNPMTGYFRNGCCDTDSSDRGRHTVCVVMTNEFLAFSKEAGNDLSTPQPQFGFPGLAAGDSWCLCALRWVEAFQAGKAPLVRLESTNLATLKVIPLEWLEQHSVTRSKNDAVRPAHHKGSIR
jgi:uncharacterized protein (DUF2237 family)